MATHPSSYITPSDRASGDVCTGQFLTTIFSVNKLARKVDIGVNVLCKLICIKNRR